MTAVVSVEAFRALGALIAAAVPELVGKINPTGQVESSRVQTYPTLTFVPGQLKFEPHQAIEHATIGDPDDGIVVFHVGERSGPLQLRIVATTPGERWTLEQRVLDAFSSQEGREGVLVVDVTAIPGLGDWTASFELDNDQWQDAGAFDGKHESIVVVNAIVPVLVVRTGVYEIDDLVLGLTSNFAKVFTSSTMVPPDVEVIQIHEDGTISPNP